MIEQGILVNRTHVYMSGYISAWDISLGKHPGLSQRMTHKGGEVWYRSQERVDNFPYGGYLSRKDWRFNEEMTIVLLQLAQVNTTVYINTSLVWTLNLFHLPGWADHLQDGMEKLGMVRGI